MTEQHRSVPAFAPARLTRRAAARLIDLTACTASIAAEFLLIRRIGDAAATTIGAPGTWGFPSDGELLLGLGMLFAAVLAPVATLAVYEFRAARAGTTLGKRVMGLCVVASRDSARPRLRWAVSFLVPGALAMPIGILFLEEDMQYSAPPLVAIGVWLAVIWVPVLFSRKRHGLHDRVAGTMVIDARCLPGDDPLRSEPWLPGLTRGMKRVPYWLKLAFYDVWKRQQR